MAHTTLDGSAPTLRVCGYARVSTGQQVAAGGGMDAQRAAIAREVEHRGWQLIEMFEDRGLSGRSVNGRPGLQAALAALDDGRADLLVTAKVDRLVALGGRFLAAPGAVPETPARA